jgi:hypothetical protein
MTPILLVKSQLLPSRLPILSSQILMAMMLLLTLLAGVQIALGQDQVVERFEAKFEQAEDINFDQWPDGWRRKKGRGFPIYSKVEIEPEFAEKPQGNRVLGLHLDGGSISVISKPFKVDSRFSFNAHAKIKTSTKPTHPCEAWYTVSFYDGENKLLSEFKSNRVRQKGQWKKVSIGPILPPSGDKVTAVVGLHLSPVHKTSLFGNAWFDDIWFARVPRVEISNESFFSVFAHDEPVKMKCRVSGLRHPQADVRLTLLDYDGAEIDNKSFELGIEGKSQSPLIRQQNPNDYEITWDLDNVKNLATRNRPGYYRLKVDLQEKGYDAISESKSFAVVTRAPEGLVSDYGWSVPEGNAIESPLAWKRLMQLANIGWLRIPVWHALDDEPTSAKIAALADELARENITLIGVMDHPPASNALLRIGESTDIAVLLRNEEAFKLAVSPVLTRLGLHVRWWQLGADNDHSLGDDIEASQKAKVVVKYFSQFGQHLRIGAPWMWLQKPPDLTTDSWDFMVYSDQLPMTAKELAGHLQSRTLEGIQSWISLQPLAADQYSLETRARDLISRIVTARRHRVPVSMMRPLDPKSGLFDETGSPTQLFVPWKVITSALNQSQYLGALQLPGDSTNHVFENSDQMMMFVWNDSAQEEHIYLGKNIRGVNLWGKPIDIQIKDGRHVIPVSNMPILVTGLAPELAKLRLGFQIDQHRLESVPSIDQPINIKFKNTFDVSLIGAFKLDQEQCFEKKYSLALRLPVGEEFDQTLRTRLSPDANAGKQMLRFDLELNSGEHQKFSVWRKMQVGDTDIEFQVAAKVNSSGRLEINATLINDSDKPVSFDCSLYLPQRRKKSIDFFSSSPGITQKQMVISDAEDLIGKTLLVRAREINGSRALNYLVEIK